MTQDRKAIIEKKFMPLTFGTSGLRDLVENMTDMECYINCRGFIYFLEERGEFLSSIAFGGDRRFSTPRIMTAVAQAIKNAGYEPLCCGKVPSPTLAFYGMQNGIPSIMVTGSHIPDNRNGIKFSKPSGEVLKTDEKDILKNVAKARDEEYSKSEEETSFDGNGMFKDEHPVPKPLLESEAIDLYISRYLRAFSSDTLKGKKIVLYQHSAVGRDVIEKILKGLGAEVQAVGRSEAFVPVDTEKVSEDTRNKLKRWAAECAPFAIVSTDGDSDRPLLADENGEFLTGDKLGALVSIFLKPDFAAVPISANDAVVSALTTEGIEVKQTKIGSPYVIAAMNEKLAGDPSAKVVSWESNGGFLLGSDWSVEKGTLKALPTRDAVLPLISAIRLAINNSETISALIDKSLPHRYTHADVTDNNTPGCGEYTADMGKEIIQMFSPTNDDEIDTIKEKLSKYFNKERGFGEIIDVNYTDGIRIVFDNGDVSHLRPSGNAPEFRNYATADTQERADEIVKKRIYILPEMIKEVKKEK